MSMARLTLVLAFALLLFVAVSGKSLKEKSGKALKDGKGATDKSKVCILFITITGL